MAQVWDSSKDSRICWFFQKVWIVIDFQLVAWLSSLSLETIFFVIFLIQLISIILVACSLISERFMKTKISAFNL